MLFFFQEVENGVTTPKESNLESPTNVKANLHVILAVPTENSEDHTKNKTSDSGIELTTTENDVCKENGCDFKEDAL